MVYICKIFLQIFSLLGTDLHEAFLAMIKTYNGASFGMLQLPFEEVNTVKREQSK